MPVIWSPAEVTQRFLVPRRENGECCVTSAWKPEWLQRRLLVIARVVRQFWLVTLWQRDIIIADRTGKKAVHHSTQRAEHHHKQAIWTITFRLILFIRRTPVLYFELQVARKLHNRVITLVSMNKTYQLAFETLCKAPGSAKQSWTEFSGSWI